MKNSNNVYEIVCPKCSVLFITKCKFCKSKDAQIKHLKKALLVEVKRIKALIKLLGKKVGLA